MPPTAIYPYEVELSMPYIYFRDTAPPDCNVEYKKYIILYYDYSKLGKTDTKEGKPVFVPYVLMVSDRFA